MAMATDSAVNFVYNELLDFFPQVDPRILKAVALENHGSIDEAFCVVIDDILPNIPGIDGFNEDVSSLPASGSEASNLRNPLASTDPQLVQEVDAIPSTSEVAPKHDGLTRHLKIVPEHISGTISVHGKLAGNEEIGNSSRGGSYSSLTANEESASIVLPKVTELDPSEGKGSEEPLDCEKDTESCMAVSGDEQTEQSCISDSGLQKDETGSGKDWFDASILSNGVAALPSQTISIELLESSIEEAKNNKKTLFSSMEMVMDAMREVDEREKAAEKAREEVAKGGTEILSRAEEMKTMLLKAKEANDMHAGEVYGERSILATEAKELQSRLSNLTEERDDALCILEEMRSSLELRLLAADEEIRKLEEEKLQKENSAKLFLDEQEDIMSKIVQESKLLHLEAEENSKLREFLVDRGQIVDALHGEIGVICQDVKSLKAKFDKRVPLSESFSSGETTCILASSSRSSSKKSLSSLVVSDHDLSLPSDSSSPSKSPTELDGDGWEILA